MARACFLNVSQFTQISFSKMEICLGYMAGDFIENPSMRAVAKLLRARASEDSSSLFCEQFEQTPNFAITFKLNGTIRCPFEGLIREVNLDVYGKRQTANGKKIKLLPSVFSSLYSRSKIFVFAVNIKRHFSVLVWFIYG